MSGYYRMYRGWMDNPVLASNDPFTKREAWEWLISSARFVDGEEWINGGPVMVLRGQICKAYRYLAKAWKWDESRVRRFCKSLEKAQMIQCGAAAGQCLITICNYDIYQTDECGDAATNGAASPQHRRSTAANIKKDNKGNKDNITPHTPHGDDNGFEAMWAIYPKKVAKDAAARAYAKALKRTDAGTILAGVKRYAAQCVGKDQQYIAHAATWLNQGRWADGGEGATGTQTSGDDFDAKHEAFMEEQRRIWAGTGALV